MAQKKSPMNRVRFAVPEQDTVVNTWIESQLNLSISLRLLIQQDVIDNGYTDVTCRGMSQTPKRGRPTNEERARREILLKQKKDELSDAGIEDDNDDTVTAEDMFEEIEKKQHTEPGIQVKEAVQEVRKEVPEETPSEEVSEEEEAPSISSMFAGGSAQKSSRQFSAAAMGLLGDDD